MLRYQTEDNKPKLHIQMWGELLFIPPDVISTIIPTAQIQANATTHRATKKEHWFICVSKIKARLVKPESDWVERNPNRTLKVSWKNPTKILRLEMRDNRGAFSFIPQDQDYTEMLNAGACLDGTSAASCIGGRNEHAQNRVGHKRFRTILTKIIKV